MYEFQGNKSNFTFQDPKYGKSHVSTIPEDQNESETPIKLMDIIEDYEKSVVEPLPLQELQFFPTPATSSRKPLSMRSTENKSCLDSDRRGSEYKNKSRLQQTPITFAPNNYEYYSRRVSQIKESILDYSD